MNRPSGIPKSVLVVTEAGDAWPSGYVRALIYEEEFKADGINVRFLARSNPWLTRLIEQPTPAIRALLATGLGRALTRIKSLLASASEKVILREARRGYDVVYLQKVASWPLAAALRETSSARLVYDLNDAVWLPSRTGFADGRVRDILSHVDAITCDNPSGLAFARQHNASVVLVADPAQTETFDQYRGQIARNKSVVTLGWIGSSATLFNLYAIWEPLEKLFAESPNLTLRVVGTGHDRRLLPPFEHVRYTARPTYSQSEMIREILQMDIGLFPMFDVQDSCMRGILKATLYMSGGVCVVASPVGQVPDLVADGQNGLLAGDAGEWLQKLRELVGDAKRRQGLGEAGLQTVREKYSRRRCYEQLLQALCGSRA